jgi:hypothetical protein
MMRDTPPTYPFVHQSLTILECGHHTPPTSSTLPITLTLFLFGPTALPHVKLERPCISMETLLNLECGPSFHSYSFPLPLTCLLGVCLTHSFHTPVHAIPYPTHSLLSSHFILGPIGNVSRGDGNITLKAYKSSLKASVDSLTCQIRPLLACFILSTSPSCHFPHPNSLSSHWWLFSLSCLHLWIFDKC